MNPKIKSVINAIQDQKRWNSDSWRRYIIKISRLYWKILCRRNTWLPEFDPAKLQLAENLNPNNEEVFEATIEALQNHRSTGVDEIPAVRLQRLDSKGIRVITKMINECEW